VAGRIVVMIACVFLLAACGNPGSTSSAASGCNAKCQQAAATGATAASGASATGTASSSGAPGCGTYCQQAGESAGNTVVGYPCTPNGCLKCPSQNCVTLGSNTATVANGVAAVQLTCNLSTECQGAVLLCLPNNFCETGPTEQSAGGRIAASDFKVAAGATSNVPVGVTPFGEQVVTANPSGLGVAVLVDMLDYGYVYPVNFPPPSFTLTTSDPPTYPSGATTACGGTVFAGKDTSCPFAQNVAQAYTSSVRDGNGTVTASSPVTGETYQMQCTGGSPVVCQGGNNAVVEFYT
jgi:hypothetical protein